MKITVTQAVQSFQVLQRLGGEKYPIKLAYNLERNMRLLKPEFEDFEKQRVELITKEFGVKTDKGSYAVPPNKSEEFSKRMDEIGSEEIELDLHAISMANLEINIAPNDLLILDWMFVE